MSVTYGNRSGLCMQMADAALAAGAAHVLVVANGCPRNVVELLMARAEAGPDFSIILLDRNFGSSGGFNRGIREAIARGWSTLWLLDDDNTPAKSCLKRQMAVMAGQDAGVAVVANRVMNINHRRLANGEAPEAVFAPPGSFLYQDLGRRLRSLLSRKRKASGIVTRYRPMPSPPRVPASEISQAVQIQLPYAPYGGLLLSASVIRKIGLPDESLFLYEDDTEYTSRIVSLGGSLLFCAAAIVEEVDSKWTDAASGSRFAAMLRSSETDRFFFSVRNRVFFDKTRSVGAVERLRYVSNKVAISIVVIALSIRTRDRSVWSRYATAVNAGEKLARMPYREAS
ncbi:glycosyltransferase [Williamsia muralis]